MFLLNYMNKFKNNLRRIYLILRKDFLISSSYRMSFLSQFFIIIFQILLFFFLSKFVLIPESFSGITNIGNYFLFVVFGVCFIDILSTISNWIPKEILEYKKNGVFEEILSLEESFFLVTFSSGIYISLVSLVKLILAFLISSFLLGYLIIEIDMLPFFLLSSFLMIISFILIGIIASSFTIKFYKVGPIPVLFLLISIFFGGAYFPTSITPEKISFFSNLTTFSFGLESVRILMADNVDLELYFENIIKVLILTTIYFFIAFLSLRLAIKNAKKNATFLHY